jgi:hypothetical protein
MRVMTFDCSLHLEFFVRSTSSLGCAQVISSRGAERASHLRTIWLGAIGRRAECPGYSGALQARTKRALMFLAAGVICKVSFPLFSLASRISSCYIYTPGMDSPMANHYQHGSERPLVRLVDVSIGVENSVHAERHYAVAEIAAMWNLSVDKVRELFADEPGVLVIGQRHPHKRRYVTLRVPKSVVERVHRRLSYNPRSHFE